jgi:SPP1 family predicted phage head-tail adaptor
MTFDAGKLRNRITIQYPIDSPAPGGGGYRTWATVAGCGSVPAQIVYPPPSKKGDEVYTQQQKRASLFTTITIRYRPSTNIDASMRILYGTRIFEVRTPIPDDTYKQFITIQCEELQARGSLHVNVVNSITSVAEQAPGAELVTVILH